MNGAARFTQRLAAGLAARWHEVHVLCPASAPGSDWLDTPPGPVGNRIVVHRIASHAGRAPSFRVGLPWRLTRPVATAIDSVAPHVVHVQSHFLVGRVTAAAAARRGIPVIATNYFMPENLVGFLRVPAFLHAGIARLARTPAPRQPPVGR